ncbi:hypothetical protein DPMN_117960 [Dreissena polymorpha]|uniref:Uncharacterized protein n=1 Tax=Dreissena polymorpha TaxID=45954 RepID=A0A9D4GFV9_DREPO|nr:hypothetical protein DPMN_117960 [Dreissena polymorpha]
MIVEHQTVQGNPTATAKVCAMSTSARPYVRTVPRAGWVLPAMMCVSMEPLTLMERSVSALPPATMVLAVTFSVQAMVCAIKTGQESATVTLLLDGTALTVKFQVRS